MCDRDVAVIAQWLLALAWFGLTGIFAWRGFATSLMLFGEHVLGLVLAGLTRSWVGAVVFAVLLALGLWLGPNLYRSHRPDQTPQPRVHICQEHSGGDNRCPGN